MNQRINSTMVAVMVMLVSCGVAGAQTTTTTTDTSQIDVNQLLDQFGGLFGLNDVTTGISTTPNDAGTGTGDTTTPPTTPPGDGAIPPQPQIVSNQFTTTGSSALNARAPGLMVQRAIEVQTGAVTLEGNATSEPGWAMQTLEDIGLSVIDTIGGIVTSVSGLFDFSDVFNPGSSTGSTTSTLPNAATTGGGTTQQIP